jgi:hypothetical protein
MSHGIRDDISAQGQGEVGGRNRDVGSGELIPGASQAYPAVNDSRISLDFNAIEGGKIPKTLLIIRGRSFSEKKGILVNRMVLGKKGKRFIR